MFKGIFLITSIVFLLIQFLPSEHHISYRHPDRCTDTDIVPKCYEWTGWSSCDVTCGSGGTRHCNVLCHFHPVHAIYTQKYQCFKTITQSCHSFYHCPPVNGGWGAYTYGSCSVTCGGGTKVGTRTCNNPGPQYGGATCTGSTTITAACNSELCPVDGGWSGYSILDPCTGCGPGTAIETRQCNNPAPQNGGTCPGSDTNTVNCPTAIPCDVDGDWSEWAVASTCSAGCGGGVRSLNRVCDNPTPVGTGAACSTSPDGDTKTETCNSDPCPVDGVFTAWEDTPGECCSTGIQQQTRTCTNPSPVGSGNDCVGPLTQTIACADTPCGGWSEFSNGDACSNLCGDGVITETRTCDNPPQSGTGANCVGTNVHTVTCTDTSGC